MKKVKRLVCVCLCLMLIILSVLLSLFDTPVVKASDDFDIMRQRWKNMLDGGPDLDVSDPVIAAKVSAIASSGNSWWTSMNKSGGRTYLWSDCSDGASNPAHISESYDRLRQMAYAYSTKGSSLYKNASLASDIISAMDWLNANWYKSIGSEYGNTWYWDIGIPQRMKDIMILMYEELTSQQLTNYINAIYYHGPDITSASFDSLESANRIDILNYNLGCGILMKNSTVLTNVRNETSIHFSYVTSGDGFYTDGSYIMHFSVPYTGTYGNVMLEGLTDMMLVVDGISPFDFSSSNKQIVYEWVYNSFEPIIYKGAAMDMVRGRAIAREHESDHVTGHQIIGTIAKLAQIAPVQDSINFKRMVKYWVGEDTFRSVYDDVLLYETVCIKDIMDDPNITPRGELIKHVEFANMDRTVHLAEGFAFAVSRSSKRVQNFELTNGENGKGWCTGDGMTYLYNNDLGQFAGDFWCTVNPLRLPGTTVEVRSRYFNDYQVGDGEGKPTNSWSGGTTLGNFGVSGMHLIPRNGSTTGSLDAYKSWFMFDDEVVCVGSKITANSGYRVESIVENRKLNSSGDNALIVNGTAKPTSIGWSETMSGVVWMHLEGNVPGSDIGYYFPGSGGATISGIRQSRTSTWRSINDNSSSSTDERTERYMTLYYDHGVNPNNASYQYVILPNKSSSEVSSYASNPEVVVIDNTTSVHSVKEITLNVAGYNFFTDTTVSSGDITCNKKASIMTREELGNTYEIAVSDPTFENTGTIGVEINKPALSVISKDPQITVTQLSPTIKFTVNVNGAKGKSFYAKFQLKPPITKSDVLWTQNFNDGTAGQPPAGWTIINSTNCSALIDNTPSVQNKSVKMTDNNTSGQSIMKKTFPAQSNLLVAEWKFMEPAGAKWPYFKILNGSTEAITLNSGYGRINFIGSTGVNQPVMPISVNTWYTVKLVVDIQNKQYDIYVNDVLKVVRASFRNPSTSLDTIQFQTGYSAPNGATLYVDDVTIRTGTAQ